MGFRIAAAATDFHDREGAATQQVAGDCEAFCGDELMRAGVEFALQCQFERTS